jgi:hypothetical protein
MDLVQFNEAYRALLDSGEWYIEPHRGEIRLTRKAAEGCTCPVSAVASHRFGRFFSASDYGPAAHALGLPWVEALYLTQIADYGGSQIDLLGCTVDLLGCGRRHCLDRPFRV